MANAIRDAGRMDCEWPTIHNQFGWTTQPIELDNGWRSPWKRDRSRSMEEVFVTMHIDRIDDLRFCREWFETPSYSNRTRQRLTNSTGFGIMDWLRTVVIFRFSLRLRVFLAAANGMRVIARNCLGIRCRRAMMMPGAFSNVYQCRQLPSGSHTAKRVR
jgi:hypothetical protein